MESDDEHREAAVLRRAVASQQAAHGKTSRLSLPVINLIHSESDYDEYVAYLVDY